MASESVINQCSRCGTRGYEYKDEVRKLCHLCIQNDIRCKPVADEIKAVFQKFFTDDFRQPWKGCEFGKGHIGNSLIQAVREYEPDWNPFSAAASQEK